MENIKITFTVPEAAEILSCHHTTIRRAVKEGRLKAAKVGRVVKISKNDLSKYYHELGGGKLFDS
jgi:excisionase family DNA binding protein